MKFFKDVVLTVLACAAVLLALEAGLRLTHERYDASLFQPEPERGYSLRPYAEGWNVTGGEAYVRINSDGMRDRERLVRRPVDMLRVAVLGASNAEAREVTLEQTFEAVMERELGNIAKRRGTSVEVLNFGVTGHTIAQQYMTLRSKVWKYDPRVVMVIWDEFLVLKNTLKTLPEGPDGDRFPFYSVKNGRLVENEPTQSLKLLRALNPKLIASRNRMADLINSSYLLSMVNWSRVELQRHIGTLRMKLHLNSANTATNGPKRADNYIQWWPFLADRTEMREDWEIGEAFLLAMREECKRHNADFFVVISDAGIQSHPDLAVRKEFMLHTGLATLDQSDERVERFCRENGIHVLALAPPLGKYALEHRAVLHGIGTDNAGHWNLVGNKIVGQLLKDELLTQSANVQAWIWGNN